MRLRGEVEPCPVLAILYLDNPKVRIERDFALESILRLAGIDGRFLVRPGKKPLDAERRGVHDGLRRGFIECRAPVQVIDFDENGPSLGGPASAEDGACPFHSASTQIGRDPNVGAQAQRI